MFSACCSFAVAACNSCTNQLMAYHRKADKKDKTIKCTLYVATRRASRTVWRAAKEAFVAVRRDELGPGVKIEEKRSVRNSAIAPVDDVDWKRLGVRA